MNRWLWVLTCLCVVLTACPGGGGDDDDDDDNVCVENWVCNSWETDGIGDAVGPDFAWIVDPKRDPGSNARADDQQLGFQVALDEGRVLRDQNRHG